ncbi:probable transmembrane ascorbate ferrireductase 4 [Tanacetum coccineum]
MSTQDYMKKVVEDVGEDEDFKSGSWVNATNRDLTVTMKDLSGTIPGTIHHKVIGEGGYGKDITVGVVFEGPDKLNGSLQPIKDDSQDV